MQSLRLNANRKRRRVMPFDVPSEVNEQRLKDLWQDLCAGVDGDRLEMDEAIEMWILLRDTPRVIRPKEQS